MPSRSWPSRRPVTLGTPHTHFENPGRRPAPTAYCASPAPAQSLSGSQPPPGDPLVLHSWRTAICWALRTPVCRDARASYLPPGKISSVSSRTGATVKGMLLSWLVAFAAEPPRRPREAAEHPAAGDGVQRPGQGGRTVRNGGPTPLLASGFQIPRRMTLLEQGAEVKPPEAACGHWQQSIVVHACGYLTLMMGAVPVTEARRSLHNGTPFVRVLRSCPCRWRS